ncbi:SWIM zinc finger family protein [Nocardioides sp. NPDC051685]|uniref:SWIM zinc finger family protein n=1 Tax=Nocardioides sp. NPDC051685 TaxID=3364334 RepID=UPI00379AAB45
MNAIIEVVAGFDDDAWVALANKGLLRRARKDLDAVEISLVSESETAIEVAVGDRAVTFGSAGPTQATCSCPSAVICQHVIAAGLWLASSVQSEDATGEADRTDPAEARGQELMDLTAEALRSHSGLPGYRWAHQFLDDADRDPVLTPGASPSVRFLRPPLTARYPGGGLDGIVLDQKVPHPERYRVAAVLAWQRAHGLVLPAPAPVAARTTGEPTLESRDRLRETVTRLLEEVVAVGVSHLSAGFVDRFDTAAVWAQGADYHRMARLLRRISDHISLLLARSAAADDLALLEEVAVAYALVSALDAAAAEQRAPVALTGRARTSYDAAGSLELVGLGGYAWRTGSGYHGLTCLFWSPAEERMLTWSDARPVSLAGFDPVARWSQPGPWPGLDRPAATLDHRVVLTGAQVNDQGRISGTEATSAAVLARVATDLPVRTSWAGLGGAGVPALSDPVDPSQDWAVLAPAGAEPPRWDAAAQMLRWVLRDAEGEALALELAWAPHHAAAIARIEAIGDSLPADTLVVARVERRGGRLAGLPLSLITRGSGVVDPLHFATQGSRTSVAAGLVSDMGSASGESDDETDVHAAVPGPLADHRGTLEAIAQRGCAGLAPVVVHDRIGAGHRALRDVGLSVFGDPDPATASAAAVLRSLYLCRMTEVALTGR